MLETVRRALGRTPPTSVLHECRHCGTAVTLDDDACPACDSDEVATYEL